MLLCMFESFMCLMLVGGGGGDVVEVESSHRHLIYICFALVSFIKLHYI